MFINFGKQLIEQKLYTMADHQSQIEKELQENDFFTTQIILKNYTVILIWKSRKNGQKE